MRYFLATISRADVLPAAVLLGALFLNLAAIDDGLSDPIEPATSEPRTPAAATCGLEDLVVNRPDPSSPIIASICATRPRTETEIAAARAYLVVTATPGYTMTRQGPELAIERLHPEFVVRLTNAIQEARNAGLPFAGVFSAYRPPAFGVGGFSDKFNSLHTYGLAVDMDGIGRPGSPEAQLWHEIAAKHGIVCPYGFHSRTEWNHCQPTGLKAVSPDNPLRETVTADGPRSLEDMFEAGNLVIASSAGAAGTMAALEAREQATTAQSGDMRTAKPPPPTNGKPNPAEGRAGAKAVRVAAKKTPARPDKGHVRDAAAKRRIIADEEDEGRRRRKSGHGSASVDAKRRST